MRSYVAKGGYLINFLTFYLRYELFTYSGEKVFSGLVFCPSGVSYFIVRGQIM